MLQARSGRTGRAGGPRRKRGPSVRGAGSTGQAPTQDEPPPQCGTVVRCSSARPRPSASSCPAVRGVWSTAAVTMRSASSSTTSGTGGPPAPRRAGATLRPRRGSPARTWRRAGVHRPRPGRRCPRAGGRIDRPDGVGQAPAHARQRRRLCHARHDGPMANVGIAGLVLTPGASAGRDAVRARRHRRGGEPCRRGRRACRVPRAGRRQAPHRSAGRLHPDRARRHGGAGGAALRPDRPHRRRRSFLRGPDVLHGRRRGPGRGGPGPGQLSAPSAGSPRAAAHRALPRASPAVSLRLRPARCLRHAGELERETAAIPGPVTRVFVDGDHSLRKSEAEVAEIVAGWVAGISLWA